MTPDQAGPLYQTAAGLLQGVVDGFQSDGITLPARQYVVPGVQPAYDDAQLTVAVQAVRVGVPGAENQQPQLCGPLLYASYRLELVLCTPTQNDDGEAPTADQLDASAREVLQAVALLARHARATAKGLVTPGTPVWIGPATPLGPEGGLTGALIDVDVPLE